MATCQCFFGSFNFFIKNKIPFAKLAKGILEKLFNLFPATILCGAVRGYLNLLPVQLAD